MLQLQDTVLKSISDPALYHPGSREVFQDTLQGSGLVVGCWVDQVLVGFRSIWYPMSHKENLGLGIGLTSPEQLQQVAHLERACVIPDYRKNNLQNIMTSHAIRLAKQNNYFRYLMSTVSPTNYASIKDKFDTGMIIVKLEKKYKGYYRYIFFQDLLDTTPVDSAKGLIFIDGHNIQLQLEIFQNYPNAVGCMLKTDGNLTQIGFSNLL